MKREDIQVHIQKIRADIENNPTVRKICEHIQRNINKNLTGLALVSTLGMGSVSCAPTAKPYDKSQRQYTAEQIESFKQDYAQGKHISYDEALAMLDDAAAQNQVQVDTFKLLYGDYHPAKLISYELNVTNEELGTFADVKCRNAPIAIKTIYENGDVTLELNNEVSQAEYTSWMGGQHEESISGDIGIEHYYYRENEDASLVGKILCNPTKEFDGKDVTYIKDYDSGAEVLQEYDKQTGHSISCYKTNGKTSENSFGEEFPFYEQVYPASTLEHHTDVTVRSLEDLAGSTKEQTSYDENGVKVRTDRFLRDGRPQSMTHYESGNPYTTSFEYNEEGVMNRVTWSREGEEPVSINVKPAGTADERSLAAGYARLTPEEAATCTTSTVDIKVGLSYANEGILPFSTMPFYKYAQNFMNSGINVNSDNQRD